MSAGHADGTCRVQETPQKRRDAGKLAVTPPRRCGPGARLANARRAQVSTTPTDWGRWSQPDKQKDGLLLRHWDSHT